MEKEEDDDTVEKNEDDDTVKTEKGKGRDDACEDGGGGDDGAPSAS